MVAKVCGTGFEFLAGTANEDTLWFGGLPSHLLTQFICGSYFYARPKMNWTYLHTQLKDVALSSNVMKLSMWDFRLRNKPKF